MNPGAWNQAQDVIGQGMQSSQISNSQAQENLDQSYRMNPMLLRRADLGNQTAEAHLPGIVAESGMASRKNKLQGMLEPQMLEDMKGKFSSDALKRHVEDIDHLGSILMAEGQNAFSNPVGAAQRVRKSLEDAGHGDMWNPAWDQSDPGLLAKQLIDYGRDLQDVSPQLRKALALQEMKGETAVQVQGMKTEALNRATQARSEIAKALIAQKREATATPKGLADWVSKMMKLEREETDPAAKQALQVEIDKVMDQVRSIPAVAAGIGAGVKPDLNTMGLETVKPAPIPRMAGAQPPIPAASAAPAPKAVSGYHPQSPEGQDWIERAMRANPGMTDMQIMQEGLKSGKLKQ